MNKTEINEIELIDGSIATIKDTEDYKALKSEGYNFFFNKKDGFFLRFGKSSDYSKKLENIQDLDFKMKFFSLWSNIWKEKLNLKEFIADLDTDGSFDATAVEIVDWEISELCDANCGFCYKINVSDNGKNISFEDFKKTFKKLPKSVTTIAFGIGSISLCPDLFNILEYTRNQGVIPTITINGYATDEELDKLSFLVGACAVSIYNKNKSYNCIKRLTDNGLEQCNIHALICEETYEKTLEILNDINLLICLFP